MKKIFMVAFLLTAAFTLAYGGGNRQQSTGTGNWIPDTPANNTPTANTVTNQYDTPNAQQRYALVIGNGNYSGISSLSNPVNDANDMEAALRDLGFTVEKVLNGNLIVMENAILNLSRRLGASRDSYGFFFYAGHGVQSNGDNYLIPVDAGGIQTENHLRQRAVSVQTLLDNLNDSGNELNMIVLDACRDNPFGWGRSGSRGLTVVSRAPTGSIIMYATGANSVAADGTGRNGLFTSQLLNNLRTPGLSVQDVFNRTGEGVLRASNGTQYPELSVRYFGASSIYLGARPSPTPSPTPTPSPQPAPVVVTPQPTPAPAPVVNTAQSYYDRGVAFYNQSNWDAAIREFTEAIRLNPNYAFAYTYRGFTYRNKSDYDRAIADYTQAIRIDPNYALAYNNRGAAYNYKNDYDRAIADYTQAIRIDPNYALAYYNRGNAYNKKKDYDRAIADCTQAIRINPNYADAYNDRGFSYNNKRDYDRAIADCTQAIRINPNSADAYNNRGAAYYGKRDYDRAIADYTQAIRINPNYALVYYNRGNAYQEKGDRTRANADFAKARELGYR